MEMRGWGVAIFFGYLSRRVSTNIRPPKAELEKQLWTGVGSTYGGGVRGGVEGGREGGLEKVAMQ